MLEKLKVVIAKVNEDINMDTVTLETKLVDDLGLDSLSMMLLAMEIEAAFGFRFTEAVRFVTVNDVCEYVKTKI